ncbi:hypothetical protein SE15_04825 [Thermanaerothrix daxensis]|uniref:Uncharacterized protein n=1 Tax=Thermanaerothrix daxensis TaxID=869279 RepID=A0A0P6YHJ4_9CHLR|nr:hypothetical protein [Thermanaerothrix daxensis]KPL84436.1 hypothetical protein SE15_04825 [Thermanaerothrix daxensis]
MRLSDTRLRLLLLLPLGLCLWLGVAWINLPPAPLGAGRDPLHQVINLLVRSMFSLPVLVTLFLPFWLGLEWAAHYQSEIFTLPHPGISRQFLLQVSLGLLPQPKLDLHSEQLSASQQQNPILLIGGPGQVNCSAEVAAVFERPNGRPRFILPGTSVTIERFERLRRIFDLRDHELQYDEIQTRSRDGIRILLQDVRVLFSIWRRFPQPHTLQNPYPTYRQNLYWLTYRQLPGPWVEGMRRLVARELQNQIRSRPFGELVAGVGQAEIRQQAERQRQITNLQWANPLERPLRFIYTPNLPPPLSIANRWLRPQLTQFFDDFADQFPRLARNQGIRLEWINVGAWNILEPIVWEQHLETLKLARENLRLGSERVLQEWREQNLDQALAQRLREVPILAFFALNQGSHDIEKSIFDLLRIYQGILSEAAMDYNPQEIPPRLRNALEEIEQCLNTYMQQQGKARFYSP